jgi:hypothetical protein
MSLLRSISDGLRSPPAFAEQQLQRLHVFDTVMAGLAGAHTPEAADLQRTTLSAGSIADRAGLSRATARLSEIEDAVATATDLMVRFGVAIDGADVLYRGGWPTSLAAPLGAAATAAGTRGIRLNPKPLQSQPSANLYSPRSQKRYRTGRQCLAAPQAFRSLGPAAAKAVRVCVPPISAGMMSARPDSYSRSSTLTGAPRQLARAVLEPEWLPCRSYQHSTNKAPLR